MDHFNGQVIALNVIDKHLPKIKTIYLYKCRVEDDPVLPANDRIICSEVKNLNHVNCKRTWISDDNIKRDTIDYNCDSQNPDRDAVKFQVTLDPRLVSCLTNEILNSRHFRNNFYRNVLEGSDSSLIILNMKCKRKSYLSSIEADVKWCCHMLPYLTMRLEFEDAFSWLSTLGGAYSSLGDQFHHCASTAGKISQQQFSLAQKLGDPYLMARCQVFLSLSLMQRGFLRHAQFILRKQYSFAAQQEEIADLKLVAMCKGAWCKLQYLYHVKKQRRKLQKAGTF